VRGLALGVPTFKGWSRIPIADGIAVANGGRVAFDSM
jgi:hypothetical protein